MTSSYNKGRVYWLGEHRRPDHPSLGDHRAGLELWAQQWLNIPVVKDTTIKLDIIAENSGLDERVKAWGLPMTRDDAITLIYVELKSRDDVVKSAQDPLVKSVLSKFPEFRPDRGANVFIAESKVLIDKKLSSTGFHYFSICEVLDGAAPEECEKKLDALAERVVNLPVAEKTMTRYTMYRQDSSMDAINTTQLNIHHGANYTFLFHKEFQNQNDMMEFLSDPGFADVITEANKFIKVTPITADITTKFQQK
ncbi:hypothetical protein FB45DRAFT_1028905 [Roridomyces roridus]|uniref:Uncharacterized protein n=1 Tax=Roridomyces roridus TaxID=1738132 RepID=A0AAD7BRZ1_9AGAR|nr:hypothetical protein FB45DRAFT_1028905 [Roridomyces roridus]